MQFTPRNKQILLQLLNTNDPVLEQKIAEALGVSLRTVQREFDYIEKGLPEYSLCLKKKKNTGVWLEGNEQKLAELRQKLEQFRQPAVTDKDQRIRYLIFELLRDKSPKKLYYFSNLFGVSESTISSDLETVQEWFASNNLEIMRKPGYGIVLKGKEKSYRRTLQRFIKENINDESIRRLLYKDELAVMDAVSGAGTSKNIYELLNSEILGKISHTLDEMKESRLRQMADSSYIGLIMHITIAVDRILKNEFVEETDNDTIHYHMDEDFELVKKIVHHLEDSFQIQIPETEFGYLLLHIKGAKLTYSDSEAKIEKSMVGSAHLLDMIDQMIDAFDAEDSYELKSDEEFIQGLMIHLDPAIVRMENEMMIYNPLLAEIQSEYQDTFIKSKKAAKVIENYTGLPVSDEETGYLTMHFGAALERALNRRQRQRVVEIGVICASGFGVARLMMAKIKTSLKKEVNLNAYGRDEITPFILSKTDFFITSFHAELKGADCLQVSPLILASDLSKIKGKVEEYSRMPLKIKDTDFTRQLDEVNFTVNQIRNLIRNFRLMSVQKSISFEALVSYIANQLTESSSAAALLRADLLEREQVMTQVYPEAGFALLHCRTKSVREIGFYLCRPSESEVFTSESLQGIKTAIVLLMPIDEYRNLYAQILGYISSSMIDDRGFIDAVFRETEDNVKDELQKVLKNYFNEFLNRV